MQSRLSLAEGPAKGQPSRQNRHRAVTTVLQPDSTEGCCPHTPVTASAAGTPDSTSLGTVSSLPLPTARPRRLGGDQDTPHHPEIKGSAPSGCTRGAVTGTPASSGREGPARPERGAGASRLTGSHILTPVLTLRPDTASRHPSRHPSRHRLGVSRGPQENQHFPTWSCSESSPPPPEWGQKKPAEREGLSQTQSLITNT